MRITSCWKSIVGLALAAMSVCPEVIAEADRVNYALNGIPIARPVGSWRETNVLARVVNGNRLKDMHWGTFSPCELTIWFACSEAAPVDKVLVYMGPEDWAPALRYRGELQSYDGKRWVTLKSFEQNCALNDPLIWEGPAVKIHGIRLIVADSDWRIAGGGGMGDVYITEVEAFGPVQKVRPLNVGSDIGVTLLGLKDTTCKFSDGRIFPLGKPAAFKTRLRNTAKLPAGKYEVRCDILDWYLNKITSLPARSLASGKDQTVGFSWNCKKQGPYFADVSIWKDNALMGHRRELFGIRDDRLFKTGKIEALPYPPGKKQKTFAELTGPGHMLFGAGDLACSNLPTNARAAKIIKDAGYDCIKAWQSWNSLEPLPGVYAFDRIDEVFRNASKIDLGVGIWFGFTIVSDDTPVWLYDELKLFQTGSRIAEYPPDFADRDIANHGPKARIHRVRLAQLLASRYGKHPSLVNWMPNPVDPEAGIHEDPCYRRDYSRWAAQEFRVFLKDFKGWNIDQVNARWGADYSDWEDIVPPRPYFELNGDVVNAYVLDARPVWLDWTEYREWSQTNVLKSVIDPLRAASPNTPMNLWSDMGWGEEYYLPYLSKAQCGACYTGMGHGNGVQIPKHAGFARQFGVSYRNEYHALAPNTVEHWHGGIYDQLSVESRYFDWISLVPSSDKEIFPIVPSFYKTKRVKEMLDDLSSATRPQGEVGYLWSMLATQLQGKGGCWSVDVETWMRMMAVGDFTQKSHRWIEPIVFGGPLERLSKCKAVFADACRVIKTSDVEATTKYVRGGGKLVTTWLTGQHERPALGQKVKSELPLVERKLAGVRYWELKPTYPLLTGLGYENPDALPEPARRGTLKVTSDHPALKDLDGASIEFWVPLNPSAVPGSRVLATADGQPVALSWNLGQGEVVLLGCLLGDVPTEDYWLQREGRLDKARSDEVTKAVEKGFDEIASTTSRIMSNLLDWTATGTDLIGPADVRGFYSTNGDTRYAMLINFTNEDFMTGAKSGTVWKFPSLPDGSYDVTVIRLDGDADQGVRSAQELRDQGVTLDFKPQEFVSIRVRPVGKKGT